MRVRSTYVLGQVSFNITKPRPWLIDLLLSLLSIIHFPFQLLFTVQVGLPMYRAGQVKLCVKRVQRKETRANQVTEMFVLHIKISDVIYIPLS